ncbi:MAG: hypothetical protein ACKPJF_09620 [Dolichospermum sp.]
MSHIIMTTIPTLKSSLFASMATLLTFFPTSHVLGKTNTPIGLKELKKDTVEFVASRPTTTIRNRKPVACAKEIQNLATAVVRQAKKETSGILGPYNDVAVAEANLAACKKRTTPKPTKRK